MIIYIVLKESGTISHISLVEEERPKICNLHLPVYPKLRSVDSFLSVINYTLYPNFSKEERKRDFNFH